MKTVLHITACLLALLLMDGWLIPSGSSVRAQEPSSAEETEPEQATESSESQQETPQLTYIERLRRLERDLEADRARLTEIKENLADREAFVDNLAANIEEAEAEIAAKRLQLEELGGAEASAEASALAEEIASLEDMIQIGTKQSDIAFQSAKTLQGQIQALEKKIANMEAAYQAQIGPTSEELAVETVVAPDTTAPEPTVAPGLTPAQVLIPGSPTRAAPEATAERMPSTAEQLEARREAEKLEEAALEAQAAMFSFVERKEALENQIEIEQQLLETARESRDNLDLAQETMQAELERLIAEGAGQADLEEARNGIETAQDLQRENQRELDQRREYLNSLHERLQNLQEEQLLVQEEADASRLEAKEARKKSIWLESPLHPRNLWRWFSTRGPRMLVVVFLAWVLLALVRMSARPLVRTVVGHHQERVRGANRADTLALSLRSALSLLIVVGAVLLVFQEAGVDLKTVLGGAAILGVAFAFGAQNLMRDYFTGFMILMEDQFELGDLITIGSITGTVEKVNMRTTMLRDIEGRMHFIPNGEIKAVTNRTYVWGRAVLEIPIRYNEDVERVMKVILEVAREFREDPEVGDWVTDEPVMLGVDKFTEYGVVIKFMIQTRPDKIFPTRRQLLLRIKKRFDEEGIEISVPHRVLIQEKGDDARS